MINFTKQEAEFLNKQEVARVATVSEKGWPQVTPVVFTFYNNCILFSSDYTSKKFRNIKRNSKVGIAIDKYARQPISVIVQGKAEIIERGAEFARLEKVFEQRHSYYKANPIKEGYAPIILVKPVRKFSSF